MEYFCVHHIRMIFDYIFATVSEWWIKIIIYLSLLVLAARVSAQQRVLYLSPILHLHFLLRIFGRHFPVLHLNPWILFSSPFSSQAMQCHKFAVNTF